MVLRVRGGFSSHGEIMKVALTTMPVNPGDMLLVDEPESGQDADGVQGMRRSFDALCAKGCQVITASHHPLMWNDANIIELVPGYVKQVNENYCKNCCRDNMP